MWLSLSIGLKGAAKNQPMIGQISQADDRSASWLRFVSSRTQLRPFT